MNTAVIGLGSNINPKENIAKALDSIKENFTLLKSSEFIQTKPIGYADQDDFINGSVLIKSKKDQEELKQALKNIEQELGRKRSPIKFGPRTIDLDIVIFNNKIVDKDFYERDFVKNAALELLPDLEH